MMWSTQTFDGYPTYSNSLDYQSNLINSGNANIYQNTNSTIKQSSPSMIAHSPISEDESSLKRKRRGQRNSRKVMIEKRRRDRINLSLDELRKLVPAANEKQGSAKLEKAEILQMTVDHLKQLHAKGFDTFSFDPHNFATKHLVFGFKECAEQVNRYLSSIENCGLNNDSRQRLFSHLQHYIAKRECDLKANNSNGLSWNPNLFLIPPSSTNSFSNGTTNSLVNTTSAQQMLNSTSNLSPITTLTSSSLSSHSNSSNSSSYHQQVNNQQNDHSTSTSPLSESPVANNSSLNGSSLNGSSLNGSSLNSSQLTASQLLSQHSYIDNNNNTSNSSSNNSLHSDSTSNNSPGQTSNTIDENGRNNLLTNQLSNQLINSQVSNNLSNIMGPPPPLLQKVNALNGISSHSTNASELTYTNMHPCSNATAYGAHHSIAANGYSNSYVAAIQHHSNHIHTPYFNSALAYGTSVGQMSAGASVVANVVSLPNSSVSHSATNQAYLNSAKASYCRPWGPEMKISNY